MGNSHILTFVIGMVAGAWLTWTVAIAQERFRRVRRDLRSARAGVKTLRKMLLRNVGTLAGAGALTILGLVGVIVMLAVAK